MSESCKQNIQVTDVGVHGVTNQQGRVDEEIEHHLMEDVRIIQKYIVFVYREQILPCT